MYNNPEGRIVILSVYLARFSTLRDQESGRFTDLKGRIGLSSCF